MRDLHSMFPNLFDTKYMAHTESLNPVIFNSNLSGLYEHVRKSKHFRLPGIEMDDSSNKYGKLKGNTYHEAAFDALATGYIFARLLGYYFDECQPLPEFDGEAYNVFRNKIFLMRSFYPYWTTDIDDQRKFIIIYLNVC